MNILFETTCCSSELVDPESAVMLKANLIGPLGHPCFDVECLSKVVSPKHTEMGYTRWTCFA